MDLFTFNQVKKEYNGTLAFQASQFAIKDQKLVAFIGNSGSGKSTLLHLLASIIQPSSGDIYYQEMHVNQLNSKEREYYLREVVDVIFQEYNLIDNLSVYENLLIIKRINRNLTDETIDRLMKQLDIHDIRHHYITQISGGQAQRVAIARAMLKDTKIILADEPTGALDINNTIKVMNLFKQAAKTKAVLYVTHDLDCAAYAHIIYIIKDGEIIGTIENQNRIHTRKLLEDYFLTGVYNDEN